MLTGGTGIFLTSVASNTYGAFVAMFEVYPACGPMGEGEGSGDGSGIVSDTRRG